MSGSLTNAPWSGSYSSAVARTVSGQRMVFKPPVTSTCPSLKRVASYLNRGKVMLPVSTNICFAGSYSRPSLRYDSTLDTAGYQDLSTGKPDRAAVTSGARYQTESSLSRVKQFRAAEITASGDEDRVRTSSCSFLQRLEQGRYSGPWRNVAVARPSNYRWQQISRLPDRKVQPFELFLCWSHRR